MEFSKLLSGLSGPLLIGLGMVVAAPVVLPIIGSLFRPVAKAAIKGSFYVADTVQGYLPAGEQRVESFVIEAQAEYKAGSDPQA